MFGRLVGSVIFIAAALHGLTAPVATADDSVVIEARKIYTAAGPVILDGRILVENGKIKAIGKDIPAPPGVRVITAETVMPGLVDIHTHLGVYSLPTVEENSDGNEMTNPVTPQVRALESFNFDDPAIKAGRESGVTTIVSRPGSGNVIGGTSVAVKLKNAPPDRMVIMEDCDLKMAIEGNPIGVYGEKKQMPTTMMGVYYLARKAFREAEEYRREWESYEKDRKNGKDVVPPARDPGKENLVRALKREIPVHIHCATASEIMSCIRLADEFHLRLSLGHCYWAYLVVDELARRKDIYYNVGPPMFFNYYQNALEFKNNPAILANAGLKVSLQTDALGGAQQNLRELASLCVRFGMKKEDALKAVTIWEAEAVGLDKRIGSLEAGKDADLVILNGEPFEFLTSVDKVMIDGRLEFETSVAAARPAIPEAPEPGVLSLPEGLRSGSPFAIKCGTLLTMAGPSRKDAVVLVRNGKIEKAGTGVAIPGDYPVVDASAFTVMPGLVSARSHVGISANWKRQKFTDELSSSIVPELEAKHAIEPQAPLFTMIRELGITSALVTPGNANVIGGQGTAVKTAGSVVDGMIFKDKAIMVFGLGVQAKRGGQMPSTRMGIAALLRETLIKAQEYKAKMERESKKAKDAAPKKDFAMEALLPVLNGEMPVLVHAEREDDIRTALRIADEFGIRIVLEGATDAYKVIPELKKRDIPVILGDQFRGLGNIEDQGFNPQSAAILERAGIRVAFTSAEGSWFTPGVGEAGGDPLEIAAYAVKNGMSEEGALKAVTAEAARIAGLDKRVGTLEPGKDADILILRGHPFKIQSVPEAVFIDGKPVYERRKASHLD